MRQWKSRGDRRKSKSDTKCNAIPYQNDILGSAIRKMYTLFRKVPESERISTRPKLHIHAKMSLWFCNKCMALVDFFLSLLFSFFIWLVHNFPHRKSFLYCALYQHHCHKIIRKYHLQNSVVNEIRMGFNNMKIFTIEKCTFHQKVGEKFIQRQLGSQWLWTKTKKKKILKFIAIFSMEFSQANHKFYRVVFWIIFFHYVSLTEFEWYRKHCILSYKMFNKKKRGQRHNIVSEFISNVQNVRAWNKKKIKRRQRKLLHFCHL